MRRFLSNTRNKWLLGIVLAAVVAGIAGRDVTPYPTECIPDEPVDVTKLISSLA
ncbi:hypothetical protein [Prochlorococcus sp. MIT 1341]|uniref:hypothetical protein n=1 Tax=Prochlorococcus sp. MIT 1341 TaxID=3096221 RepID=UPI002A75B692|nr:hypothetical protein [Prochlorococcus sp. MIT 1341]